MIRALAELLGMEESAVHSLFHRAACDSGWRDDGVVIEWARDMMPVPIEFVWLGHRPYPSSVVLIYGATGKVLPAAEAARGALAGFAAGPAFAGATLALEQLGKPDVARLLRARWPDAGASDEQAAWAFADALLALQELDLGDVARLLRARSPGVDQGILTRAGVPR